MKVLNLKKILEKHKEVLRRSFGVKALFVFGSVARGEGTKESDIDILVEFSSEDIGLFEFVRLKGYLEKLVGVRVDLVTADALTASMRNRIDKDLLRVA